MKNVFLNAVFSARRRMALFCSTLAVTGLVQARTVNVESGTEELSENLSGSEELVKTGAGTLVLTGANSGWIGEINVQAGTLKSDHARIGKGDVTVGADGTLTLTGTAVIPSQPTRKLYLGGALKSDGFKLSSAANDWYPFAHVVLTGDASTDSMEGIGWGDLDMNKHRLTVNGVGRIEFPRVSIANPGTFVKAGGYLVFRGMTTDFGEGGVVEISGGCTLDMTECNGKKCLFKVHSTSGNNWLEVSHGSQSSDPVWAGAIEIDEGSSLMSWSNGDGTTSCIVEGKISGAGEFRTSSQSNVAPTILRGSAVSDSTGDVRLNNNDLQVENYTALPPTGKLRLEGSGNIRLIGCTTEQIADAGNRAVVASGVSGRVIPVIPVGTEQEIVPTPALKIPADGGTARTTTNEISKAMIDNIVTANYGTWVVGGFPDAVNGGLGSFAYSRGTTVFRDAGDLTWTDWVAGMANAPSNAVAPRIRFEGDTRALFEKRLYAGYGGDKGMGVVEVASNASVLATLQVGCTGARERGAVYQTGGTIVHAFESGNLGGGAGSTGFWIQRGGKTVISNDLLGANGNGSYGAYILHGGELCVASSGRLVFGRNGRFHFYIGGGSVTNANPSTDRYPMQLNADGTSDGHAEASFTMDGADARLVSPVRFDTWKANSITHYNFNAGEFVCPMLFTWGPEAGYPNAKIHIGFNGGTWRLLPSGGYLFCYDPEAADCRPTSFVIYEGGCTIATRAGTVKACCPISAPTGFGVKSVTLPEKIGGFAVSEWQAVGPMRFWFEGGNGSADAMIDFDERTGETKGVKMLCSGFGYTEAPVAYVVSPDGSFTNTCAVEMFEPKCGDFTKRGNGTLELNEPCTYTGRTIIEEGELHFTTMDCVPPAPDVTIVAGADLWPPVGIVLDTLRGNGISWYDQSVTNRLYVNYADVTNGTHLTVKKGVLNLVDTKIVVPDLADIPEDAKSVTIAEADTGITGTFTFEADEALARRWSVRKIGNRLRLVNCCHGMMLLVR